MEFNEKLMNLRKIKGMSQEELAGELDVTRQTVSKWELNQTVPDMKKLMEMSRIFDVSLDELTGNIKESNHTNTYKETSIEKNNKKISIKIFIIGLIISLIICGMGLIRQKDAQKTNLEREKQAYEESKNAIENANKRLEEIEKQIGPLEKEYEEKTKKANSLNVNDSNWYSKTVELQQKASKLYGQISDLKNEKIQLQNADYTVYYSLVEPIKYMLFYYIGAGVFALMSLIALIYYLVTRKK